MKDRDMTHYKKRSIKGKENGIKAEGNVEGREKT